MNHNMDTQTQIDRLIELAIIQRSELKQLVEQLPQLREHLNAEVEKVFEETEPQLRAELEDWTTKQTSDKTAALGAALEAKIIDLAKSLEISTQARYNAIIAEREENTRLAAQAEQKIAEHAASLPSAVKDIVTAELARFPRAGEIDQLRKEFAEPKSLNPRGKWQAGETYNKLDLVTINGDSYTSAIDGNKTRPTRSSADWTLVAARGTGGGGGPTSLTDLTAVPQNGELLIGNGSAFVNNTLTAGTGVTITNGAGTITIDASGAQELLTATVKNADSVAITKGQVVYLFGATGGFPSVKLANNTSDATSNKTFGVVSDTSIAPNGTGTVTCVGVVDGLNLGAYNDGDAVYLGATAGTFTATKPYAPNHLVFVGIIERANAGNGELYVRIQNGYELEELHNVQITTPPLAGSLLMYDATNSLWKANRLTGTANQITVTNADTAVTLSIPTNPTLNGNATVGGNLTVSGTRLNLPAGSILTLNGNATSVGYGIQAATAASPYDFRLIGSSDSNPSTQRSFSFGHYSSDNPASTWNEKAKINSYTGAATLAGNLTVSGGTIGTAASTNLTLAGGSSGASLVLGQGTNGGATITGKGAGGILLTNPVAAVTTIERTGLNTVGPAGILSIQSDAKTANDALRLSFFAKDSADNAQLYGVLETEITDATSTSEDSNLSFYSARAGSLTKQATLTSGGNLLLKSDGIDSSNGKLQLATHTTSAGGIGFGTDISLYRPQAGVLAIDGSQAALYLRDSGTTKGRFNVTASTLYIDGVDASGSTGQIILRTGNGGGTALTLDSSQRCILAGALRLNNAYTAGAPTATGYVTIQDSAGNTYKVLVGT